MSCHLSICGQTAEFICLDCPSENIFCIPHGTEHIISEKHKGSGISENIKKLLSLRESKLKIDSYITKITSDTCLIIKEIKQISLQTINKLKEANKSIADFLGFQEIHFSQSRIDKLILNIKHLDEFKKLYPEDIIGKEFDELKCNKLNFENKDLFENLKIISKKVDSAIGDVNAKEEQAILRSNQLILLRNQIEDLMMEVFGKGKN